MFVIAAVMVGVSVWLIVAGLGVGQDARSAGDEELFAPIGSLRLVAQMDPVEAADDEEVRERAPSEAEIMSAIEARLVEMKLPADQIQLTVADQNVVLEGTVDDPLLRDAVEVAARAVEGVVTVDNRITVRESKGD